MCESPGQESSRTKAARTLAHMMHRDIGVIVAPKVLEMFIIARWDKISRLAHTIHESGKLEDE